MNIQEIIINLSENRCFNGNNIFYNYNEYKKNKYGWQFKEDLNFYKGKILNYDFLDSITGKKILEKGSKKADLVAKVNLKEIYKIIGLTKFT